MKNQGSLLTVDHKSLNNQIPCNFKHMHRVNVPILKGKRRESSKEKGAKQGETQQEKHQIMKLRVGHLEILAIT